MRNDLRFLILGGGGREHALYWAIQQSPLVTRVLCTPGNGGIDPADRRDVKENDFKGIIALAQDEKIDVVVIGPEVPLIAGLVNTLHHHEIAAFGPSRSAARFEGSKLFAMMRCSDWGVPIPRFNVARTYDEAMRIIEHTGDFVVKADGPCGGKGVVVGKSKDEALEAADAFLVKKIHGEAGSPIVIAERLYGPECSVFALCDGENAILLPPARDFKRARDGDEGPNTGGMGAYCPLPEIDGTLLTQIKDQFFIPILRGAAEREMPYRGLLYAGLILTEAGPKLIEYNVRFGDPETQVVLPMLDCDIVPYLLATLEWGGLAKLPAPKLRNGHAVCTNLVSDGYPVKYTTQHQIVDVAEAEQDAFIFHAGTTRTPEGLVSSGGRVMGSVGFGATVAQARTRSLRGARAVIFVNKYFRRDIAANV